MTMTILEVCRSMPLDATEVDVVGRRLDGMAFAWDRLYKVTDDGGRTFYDEGFRRGAATQTLRARRNTFELRDEHFDDRVGLVGFAEAEDGLVFSATMDATPEGDRELDLLRANQKTGVSIRYGIVRNQPRSGPPWWRSQIELRELSLTRTPQYGDAKVLAIRSGPPEVPTFVRPEGIDDLLGYEIPSL
jgi:HK97 family phage prohead protease